MSSLEEKLQEWIVCEMNGLCEASMISIPEVSALQQLTVGKNKKIWQYVVERVKSKQTVRHIKNVLRVKQAQCELNNHYPQITKNNCDILKQEIDKTSEKAEFVESSLSNMKKNILILKQSIKSLRSRNHVISQKCTLLELDVSNYKEKDENLTTLLEHLSSLFNVVFSSEIIQQNLIIQKSLQITKINTTLQPVDDTLRYLLFQMSSILSNELLKKGEKLSYLELTKSVKKIVNSTNVLDFVNMMKLSEDFLKKDNFLATDFANQPQQNKLRMSSEHLQMLKLNHVNSSFLRLKTLNSLNKMPLLIEVITNENIIIVNTENPTLREFILVKAQNACLEENIKYLENTLSEELQKTKNIVEKNNEQKSKCVHIKSVVEDFYKMLECVKKLLETAPKIFLDSENKLASSNVFLNMHLFSELFQLKDEFNVCDVKNILQLNYTGSLDILQSKSFWSPLISCYLDSVISPEATCKLSSMEPFKNVNLLCDNLVHIRRIKDSRGSELKYDANEMTVSFVHLIESLKSKLEQLKLTTEKAVVQTKPNCQELTDFLDEWWHQKAQFIPEIVYDGKSLKMWIDILHALEDF